MYMYNYGKTKIEIIIQMYSSFDLPVINYPSLHRTNDLACSCAPLPTLRPSSKRPAITSWRKGRASWVLSRAAGRRPLSGKPTLCTREMKPEPSAGCWGRLCYRSRDSVSIGLETTLVCTCGRSTLANHCVYGLGVGNLLMHERGGSGWPWQACTCIIL